MNLTDNNKRGKKKEEEEEGGHNKFKAFKEVKLNGMWSDRWTDPDEIEWATRNTVYKIAWW